MICGGAESRIPNRYYLPKPSQHDQHLMLADRQALGHVKITAKTDRRSYRSGDTIIVSLKVSNSGDNQIKLEFPSAQLYDFVILSKRRVRWRWSSNKLFASMPVEISLDPREEFSMSEVIKAGMPRGTYTLIGMVTSSVPHRSMHRFTVMEPQEAKLNRTMEPKKRLSARGAVMLTENLSYSRNPKDSANSSNAPYA